MACTPDEVRGICIIFLWKFSLENAGGRFIYCFVYIYIYVLRNSQYSPLRPLLFIIVYVLDVLAGGWKCEAINELALGVGVVFLSCRSGH